MLGRPREPSRILVVLLALAVSIGAGCSSDGVTRPAGLSPAGDEYEVLIPQPVPSQVPCPKYLRVTALSPTRYCLTWKRTAEAYIGHVGLDGQRITEVDARSGCFTMDVYKSSGRHVFSVCFARGCVTGQAATVAFSIPPSVDISDGIRAEQDR